jgi:MprA protease rhombosortase-interaction domain-containing protein
VTAVIAIAAAVLLIAIGLIAYTRRPRQDAGLTSFRRHIDALSPESRREVMDRVRPSQHDGQDGGQQNGEASDDDKQEPTD